MLKANTAIFDNRTLTLMQEICKRIFFPTMTCPSGVGPAAVPPPEAGVADPELPTLQPGLPTDRTFGPGPLPGGWRLSKVGFGRVKRSEEGYVPPLPPGPLDPPHLPRGSGPGGNRALPPGLCSRVRSSPSGRAGLQLTHWWFV